MGYCCVSLNRALAQSRTKTQQSSRASEKEKGEGPVAVTVSTLSLLGAESGDRADVGPEYEVGRTAAPARGQDAVAELAESIRLFWSGILSRNEQTPR